MIQVCCHCYPIQVTMNLTFEQAACGCDKEVLINVSDTCPRCLGNKAEPGTRKVQCHHCGGTGMVMLAVALNLYQLYGTVCLLTLLTLHH